MGRIGSQDAHTVRLFPEIKGGLIPVLSDVIKIIGDDGPKRRRYSGSTPIRNQPP